MFKEIITLVIVAVVGFVAYTLLTGKKAVGKTAGAVNNYFSTLAGTGDVASKESGIDVSNSSPAVAEAKADVKKVQATGTHYVRRRSGSSGHSYTYDGVEHSGHDPLSDPY